MEIAIADKIELRPINTVKPYVRNPRKNDKTVELLCKVIPKVGFNVPIVVDEKGVIVKGHARFTAAIRLGLEKVPCLALKKFPVSYHTPMRKPLRRIDLQITRYLSSQSG